MSKSSKYILASGCSFTDENFKSISHPDLDVSFPKWPEILGEYSGLKVVNQGKSGAGNDYITNTLTKTILKDHKNIEMVVVGWSEIWRFSAYNHYQFNPILALFRPEMKLHPRQEASRDLYKHMFKQDLIDVHYSSSVPSLFQTHLKSWVDNMLQIQELCKLLGIKYIMAPLCGSFTLQKYKQCLKSFDDEEVGFSEIEWSIMFGKIESFYDLETDHYIGHPFLNNFGGFVMQDKLDSKFCISKDDLHPNAEGHEFIAGKFYEQYTKIYS